MKEVKYKSTDQLPLVLSVPEVAVVLGISRAGAYELARRNGFLCFTWWSSQRRRWTC